MILCALHHMVCYSCKVDFVNLDHSACKLMKPCNYCGIRFFNFSALIAVSYQCGKFVLSSKEFRTS
jgi:hypothetical protein